jgi:hypothetical protein
MEGEIELPGLVSNISNVSRETSMPVCHNIVRLWEKEGWGRGYGLVWSLFNDILFIEGPLSDSRKNKTNCFTTWYDSQ